MNRSAAYSPRHVATSLNHYTAHVREGLERVLVYFGLLMNTHTAVFARSWCRSVRLALFKLVQVGQFVASSPTLFPPEYVKEFQKCLDKTEAVPWSECTTLVHGVYHPYVV